MKGGLKQLQSANMGAGNGVGFHESKMQAWLRTGTKFGNQLQWTGRQLQYNWTLPLACSSDSSDKVAAGQRSRHDPRQEGLR